jgi:hypothetical protein
MPKENAKTNRGGTNKEPGKHSIRVVLCTNSTNIVLQRDLSQMILLLSQREIQIL